MSNISVNDLCFFVFGMTQEEIKANNNDSAIRKCINKAYYDLMRTIKYLYTTAELAEAKKGNKFNSEMERFSHSKKSFINSIEEKILSCIKDYPNFNQELDLSDKILSLCETDFDKWHYATCVEIKNMSIEHGDIFSDSQSGLSYGQIQKWLNMSLKYMRIMGFDKIDENNQHIPIDDYILTAMRKKEKICESYSVVGLGMMIPKNYKWSRDITDYKDYLVCQLKIRRILIKQKPSIIPIEWESKAWIAEATDRSNS